jgi:hypothetical protein
LLEYANNVHEPARVFRVNTENCIPGLKDGTPLQCPSGRTGYNRVNIGDEKLVILEVELARLFMDCARVAVATKERWCPGFILHMDDILFLAMYKGPQ